MSSDSPAARPISLALTRVQPETFDHDLSVSDRFQKFSEEILRLSLAGLAGIGILLVNCISNDEAHRLALPAVDKNRLILLGSLAGFGLASLAAVAHRLASTYSLSQHLVIMRFDLRGGVNDAARAKETRRSRDRLRSLGWWFLIGAGSALVSGAAMLVWFFYNIIESLGAAAQAVVTPGR